MKKRWFGTLVAVAMMMMVVLAGCATEVTPEDVVNRAMDAAENLHSYQFTSEVNLNMELPQSMLENDPSAAMGASFLKDIHLTATGAYQDEPMKTETTVDLKLGGDVGMTIRIPVIMQDEKVWVKVPDLPMLAGMIPEEMVGKYIEIDAEQIAEMDAQAGAAIPESLDVETQKQFLIDILNVLMKHYKEDEYMTVVDAEEAGVPEDVDASDVIQISLDQQSFHKAATTLVEQALPDLIDVLAKPEYKDILGDSFDAEEAKSELEDNKQDIQQGLDEMKEMLDIKKLSMVLAVDDDGNMPYMKMDLDAAVKQDGEEVKLKGDISMTMTSINEKPAFELEEPSEDNSMTMEQLQQLFGGGMF